MHFLNTSVLCNSPAVSAKLRNALDEQTQYRCAGFLQAEIENAIADLSSMDEADEEGESPSAAKKDRREYCPSRAGSLGRADVTCLQCYSSLSARSSPVSPGLCGPDWCPLTTLRCSCRSTGACTVWSINAAVSSSRR